MSGTIRDVVVMGTHPFTAGVPLGDWHLARTLALSHRVLWVDPPASPVAPLRGVASPGMFRRHPVRVSDGLFVASPIVHSGRLRPGHARVVDALVAVQVRRWMRQLDMADAELITFSPRFGPLEGIRGRSLAVWLKDRDWASEDVPHARWLRARLEELVRAADVVVGVSDVLVSDCRALGVDAIRIPNGCDTEHYRHAQPEPAAVSHLPRPRIVFSGAWNWRVDAELVAAAAARLPGFTFLVVGAATAPVSTAANVHRVEAVPYAELPGYLQASDVGIVPYLSGTFNAASCPLKVYEYLAAGLPVVVTGIDTAGLPRHLVRAVDGVDAFVRAIQEQAGRDLHAACRNEAANHSWEARAQALLSVIDSARSTPLDGTRPADEPTQADVPRCPEGSKQPDATRQEESIS